MDQRFQGWEKRRAEIVSRLEDRHKWKLAHRIRDCGKKVLIYHCSNLECGKTELRYLFSCKTILCPHCSNRAYLQSFMKYKKFFEGKVLADYKFRLITLTKRHKREFPTKPELKKLFKDTRAFVQYFYPLKQRRRSKSRKTGEIIPAHPGGCGALAVAEVGSHKNLHIHLVVLGPLLYHSRSRMAIKWHKLTGDSYIVDTGDNSGDLRENQKSALQALKYILKHNQKPPLFDAWDDYVDYLLLFERVRRIHAFGIFYGIEKKIQIPLCPICGYPYKFLRVEEKELWWDEESLKAFCRKKIDSS